MRSLIFILLYLHGSFLTGQHVHHDHNDTDLEHYTYDIKLESELKYLLPGLGLNILGGILVTNVEQVTPMQIELLDRNDINSFDRGATNNYSSSAQQASDILLYTGATLPVFTLFSHKCREETRSIAYMTAETVLITLGINNITKGLSKRYRPFNYNPKVPESVKLGKTSRLSFFSGHASVTTSLSFMSAKILTDLHPEMKFKGLVWTAAAVYPATIGYLRYKAGKHFPTDVMVGYAVGATIGYLIPTIHMSDRVDLNYGGNMMSFSIQF